MTSQLDQARAPAMVSTVPPRQWPAVLAAVLFHAVAAAMVIALPAAPVEPSAMAVELVMLDQPPPSNLPAPEPEAAPPPETSVAEPGPSPEPPPAPAPEAAPSPEPSLAEPHPSSQPPPAPAPEPALQPSVSHTQPRVTQRATPAAVRPKVSAPRRDTATAASRVAPSGPSESSPEPALTLPSSDAAYLNNPRPAYPMAARRRKMQGLVLLSVLVGTDGRPHGVVVKHSSGFEILDEAALQAVRGWRFAPGSRGGRPVEASVDVPIRFSLSDG